jgi:hypothetical protein
MQSVNSNCGTFCHIVGAKVYTSVNCSSFSKDYVEIKSIIFEIREEII